MNSRQRRGVILLLLSVLCALGAFAGVLSVISDVNSKVGPEVTAYRLKNDIAPYTPLQRGPVREDHDARSAGCPRPPSPTSPRSAARSPSPSCEKGSLLQDDMIVDAARTPGRASRRSPS